MVVAQAAEVHRTVRKWAQSRIRPGIKLAEFCEELENMNRRLVKVRLARAAAACARDAGCCCHH